MCTSLIRFAKATVALAISTAAWAQIGIEHLEMDPLVLGLTDNQDLRLTLHTYGDISRVKLVFADGSKADLVSEGQGTYTILIPHHKAVAGYAPEKAYRNFVGYLDIGDGGQANVWININDGTIPDAPVVQLDSVSQTSSRVFNLLLPNFVNVRSALETVTERFYTYFADKFDFLSVINSDVEYRKAFFVNAQNRVSGIGLSLFDDSSRYSSLGRLDGLAGFPNHILFDLASPEFLRLLGYNWMNYSHHWKLHNASPHWPISELANGMMGYQSPLEPYHRDFNYYFEREMAGNFLYRYWTGNYVLVAAHKIKGFWPFELYLMGLVTADKVSERRFLVPDNQYQQVCWGCVIKGPFTRVTIDDLLEDLGQRQPGAETSQKDFKVATIIVSYRRLLSEDEMRFFNFMASRGEEVGYLPYSSGFVTGIAAPFREATGGLGSLSAVIAPEIEYEINHGMSDAWYDPNVPGQGILVDVLEESKELFVGWFTFNPYSWPRTTEHLLGGKNHRWLTAQGPYEGPRSTLKVFANTGGVFNSDTVVLTREVGTMIFTMHDCKRATVDFFIAPDGPADKIRLERISNENVARCEELMDFPIRIDSLTHSQTPSEAFTAVPKKKAVRLEDSDPVVFNINVGIAGAWFNPNWPGQGLMISVLPISQQIFLAWYTFDLDRPTETAPRVFGDIGHRWLTAQGHYDADRAELELTLTTGGAFLAPWPTAESEPYGSINLQFVDCNHANVTFEIPSLAIRGEFPVIRISDENSNYCLQ